MKKTIILMLCYNVLQIFSQTNHSFENWTNQGTYEEPSNWYTTNTFVDIGANVSCVKASPHWGTYAIGISACKVPGFDTLGGFALQQFKYTQRAKSINLYYHYPSKKKDSAAVVATFYKGYTRDTNNIIGRATVFLSDTKHWTYKSADIVWKNGLSPDTATITILNAFKNYVDTVFVDDIALSAWGMHTNQHDYTNNANVYVNANNELVFYESVQNVSCKVMLRNTLGALILETLATNGVVNIEHLSTGVYTYEIVSENKPMFIGKFIK